MTSSPALTLAFPEPDIAVLTFDDPQRRVNVLDRDALDLLDQLLDRLEQHASLAGVILRSTKPGVFLAGADVHQLAERVRTADGAQVAAASRRGQTLFRRLEKLPAVTIAALDGLCLGGGVELASWCDRRLAVDAPATSIGCPEVHLGMIPGWGGSVRLARLVGVAPAVEWVTTGEPVSATVARNVGWVDDLVPADKLLDAAVRLVRQEQVSGAYRADRTARAAPRPLSPPERDFLYSTSLAQIRQVTKGRQPAVEKALELVIDGAGLSVDEACERESQALGALWGGPAHRGLFHVFQLRERAKRDSGVGSEAAGAAAKREFTQVGVVGTGLMGAGIAGIALRRELQVRVYDSQAAALERGAKQILDEAAYDRARHGPDPVRRELLATRLQAATQLAPLANCELVIEAIVENADAKRALFQQLEPLVKPDAVLASNTSTIPISKQAESLQHPERFCGMHFFNPVRRLPLVEVIRGRKTSDATIATAVAFAKRIGKSPIVVNDGPGFLVNRMLFPYLNEALQLVAEGVDFEEIEGAAVDFGMPVGPLELYDMVGLDTAVNAGRVIWFAFGDRVVPSPIIPAMVKAGRLGKKNGAGFFRWSSPKAKREHDPELTTILDRYRQCEPKRMSRAEILDRLLLPMLLEATRTLEDGIVSDPAIVDFGVLFGLGFPAFRGGLLFWADAEGLPALLQRCEPLRTLGLRFEPPALLRRLVDERRTYYSIDPARGASRGGI